jgi:tetratricopeptide (TPR) repeat protein
MSTVLILLWMAAVGPAGNLVEERIRHADELLRNGAYQEALGELSKILVPLETAKPTRLLITVLNNVAGIQADLENYHDAEKLYRRALHMWDHIEPADRPSRPGIQLNLLAVYVQAGWLRKAERLVEEAGNELATADLQQRLPFLDCLGNLRRAQKRLEDSAGYYHEALELAQKTGREGTAGFLWNSLGVVRVEQHKMTEAVDAFERAVGAHDSAARREHPALIATLSNLGAAYLAESRIEPAQTVLDRARSLAERFLGVSHPAHYRILMLQARMFDRMNRKAEAKQWRRRAQSIRNQGPRDPAAFVVDIEDLRRR